MQIQEVRRPGPDETERPVTAATVFADEMRSLLEDIGETEASSAL